MSDLILPGTPQFVKVKTVTEGERVGGAAPQKMKNTVLESSGAPMRCQLWDHRRLVGVVPVTFDDMGHPSDIYFDPPEIEKVTRLAFVYGGNVYAFPLGETVVVYPGNPLHLALGHMELRSKFGNVVLKAGM